jgi:hypothetical protein
VPQRALVCTTRLCAARSWSLFVALEGGLNQHLCLALPLLLAASSCAVVFLALVSALAVAAALVAVVVGCTCS